MIGDLLFAMFDLLTGIFIVNNEPEDSNPIRHGFLWASLAFSAFIVVMMLIVLLLKITS